jgi:hypothetical protein
MLRSTRLSLWVMLVGLTSMTTLYGAEKDSRLPQRPPVVKPKCSDPRPYSVEFWGENVIGFSISLRPGLADRAAEAERLARKYEFKMVATDAQKLGYILSVEWLEPEKIAALRCEPAVQEVGFDVVTMISIPHTVGPPLQRP